MNCMHAPGPDDTCRCPMDTVHGQVRLRSAHGSGVPD